MASNPYIAPANENSAVTRGRRIPWLSVVALLLSVLCFWFSFTTFAQMSRFADPAYSGGMDDNPIAALLIELFTDPGKPVIVSNVASNVQFVILLVGFVGFVLLVASIVGLIRAAVGKKQVKNFESALTE